MSQSRSNRFSSTKKTILSTIFVSLMLFASILLISNVSAYASPAAVNLGTAGNYVILSKAGITNVPGSITSITGDMGVSPIGYASITGFTLVPAVPDGSNTFSTSTLVTGKIYASDYTEPTPTDLGVAILDMKAAYNDALSRPITDPAETNVGNGAGEIGGLTLAPGVYTFTGASINVLISTDLTLNGNASDVWIFQIPGTLDVHANVILSPGVQAKNIFWVVAGATTIFPGFTVNGNILTAEPKTIAIQTGSVLNGRALSQGAVTLDADTVTIPAGVPTLTLTNIIIATPATKLTYTVGDSLDITGLTITKTYNDSSTQITTPTNVTGFDSSAPVIGQVLTVTYGSQTTNYTVDIVAAPVDNGGGSSGGGGGHFSSNVIKNIVYGVPTANLGTTTITTPTTETPTTTTTTVPSTTSGLTGAVTGIKNISTGAWVLIAVGVLAAAGIIISISSSAVKHKKKV